MAIRLLVFVNVYLITDCRCVFNEITLGTDRFVYVASRFIVSGDQGSLLRVSAKWLFILRPRGVLEYFVSLYIHMIIELHQSITLKNEHLKQYKYLNADYICRYFHPLLGNYGIIFF